MKILVMLFTLGTVVSQSAPPRGSPKPYVSEGQVNRWLKNWQGRLGLSDWTIEAQIVPIFELKPNTLGNTRWDSKNRSATIKVLDPADYDLPAARISADIEYTIVHELVHLQLSVLPRDAAHKTVEEQVVNRLTDALLQPMRGGIYRSRNVASASASGGVGSGGNASRGTPPPSKRPDPAN